MIKIKSKLILLLIFFSILLSSCGINRNNNSIDDPLAEATCNPDLGPCASIKEKKIVLKNTWPSYDALCSGQKCKIIMTNEYIQVGGTKLPRPIILKYEMQDNSNYSCTSPFSGGACKPILVGNIYYKGLKDKHIKAVIFEFRNYKPAQRMNDEMDQWFGDQ